MPDTKGFAWRMANALTAAHEGLSDRVDIIKVEQHGDYGSTSMVLGLAVPGQPPEYYSILVSTVSKTYLNGGTNG